MRKPTVWTIAGMDPSGHAGTHADLQTLKNLGVNSCSVITAVTAQNAQMVSAIEYISAEHIAAQCAALKMSSKPDVIKIGMIGLAATPEKIAHFLADLPCPVVLDPLLFSSSGTPLFAGNLPEYLGNLGKLFPFATVVTPNLQEAEKLLNRSFSSYQDIQAGAEALLALGAASVLLKGGEAKDSLFSQDYWTNGRESFWLANQRLPQKNYRGTGCTLSSAIAACLALGYSIKDAIVIAKMYTHRGIRLAKPIDQQTARLYHGGWPEEQTDLPNLAYEPFSQLAKDFKSCNKIGLYPVVDSSRWLEKLLPLGVRTIQLRIKNSSGSFLAEEIKKSIALAKKYRALLFVNDYWQLAIQLGAEGIHLGQEDLVDADLEAIHHHGIYLGVSTHCYFEVARAHALCPSYLACGPIYPTTSKIMPFAPQGIVKLKRWRRTLRYPLVAIGGINLQRLPKILTTGVEGIAVLSAITQANDPLSATQQFLTTIDESTTCLATHSQLKN
jgi:hydroxymethylpyrimidine kinase / phosphomethylpyrimidine kinase / thiamine-phosphate diphosphorylase